MVLAYHMISQDHVIKDSCDFKVKSQVKLPSSQIWWPQALWQ